MTAKKSDLATIVRARVGDVADGKKKRANHPILSPAAAAAMRLSEEFEAIVPQEYVLPLDELAGFNTSRTRTEKNA
jgi:hypothetical protein